ncbi:MAG: hypothetical protein AAF699_15635 [Pseudomonadota bacterium]
MNQRSPWILFSIFLLLTSSLQVGAQTDCRDIYLNEEGDARFDTKGFWLPGLVMKQQVPPTTNGCGAAGGDKFPNNPAMASFETACNNHDICWGTCASFGSSHKSDCDRKFEEEMRSACLNFPWEEYEPLDIQERQRMRDNCLELAGLYVTGVKSETGAKAYEAAIAEHCQACAGGFLNRDLAEDVLSEINGQNE